MDHKNLNLSRTPALYDCRPCICVAVHATSHTDRTSYFLPDLSASLYHYHRRKSSSFQPIMVCATAADLFPELVFRILSSIGHDPDPARHFYPVPMNKQHLGICSLVCRFWAQWCRPHIFYSITLRSAEDFEQLVQLMDTPSKVLPSIRQCLVKLIVIRRGACDAPYLHLIARHWEHLVDFEMLPVNSSSPLSSDSIADYAPHSMSVGLPRTLPGSMYPLYSITLSDLRFRNTGDVLKLIRNLYDLTKLECTKLRFDNVSPVLPGGTRRVRGQLLSVSISDCGSSDSNCQIELLASIVSSSFTGTNLFMSPRRLSVEAWGTICRLLTALAPSSYTHIRRDSSSGKSASNM